ncbi:MAG: hypothetical protein VYA30_15460 [Myxococcota bacterium]|nr:hypothetical protein [Myxococcota bacterium]
MSGEDAAVAVDQAVSDAYMDAFVPSCSEDSDCDDSSSCTSDRCVEGVCQYERISAEVEVVELMDSPEGVVSLERAGDLVYLARGILGTQVWDVERIPTRRLLDYPLGEDEGAHAGAHFYDGGIVIRAGRWMYILDSTGRRVSEYRSSDEIRDVIAFSEQTVALALYAKGIEIVDLGNGIFPMRVGRTDTLGRANTLVVSGDRLLVADGLLGVSIVDVADPSTPILSETTIKTSGRVDDITTAGRLVAINEAGAGLGILEATRDSVRRTARIVEDLDVKLIHASDPVTLMVVTDDGELIIVDTSSLDEPVVSQRFSLGGGIRHIAAQGRELTIERTDGRLVTASLSCGLEGEAQLESEQGRDGGFNDAGVDAGN